jgi:hypothetical protein
MHKGPSRDQIESVGPFFKTASVGTPIVGTGAAFVAPVQVIESLKVGMGMGLLIYLKETLLAPTGQGTDPKWVDIAILHFNDPTSSRAPDTISQAFFTNAFFGGMDVSSERDGKFPGTNRLVHRWQSHRLPINADPENVFPGVDNDPWPVFSDVARGDFIHVYVNVIAEDQDADPVIPQGSVITVAVDPGAFSRTM